MSILDPIEKKRVSELLARGQAIAAAQSLLASNHREHKAIRPLVLDCIEQLIEFASQLLSGGELETAASHSRMAKRLINLSGEEARLAGEIENLLDNRDKKVREEQALIGKAKQLVAERRLETAFEHSDNLRQLPDARSLLDTIETNLKTYRRYVENCQQAVAKGALSNARNWLTKAKAINQTGKELPELEEATNPERKTLEFEDSEDGVGEELDSCQLVHCDDDGFLMDFGDAEQNTLVLFRHSLVLGAAKNSSRSQDVCRPDLRIRAGFLSGQHAVLFRHFRHGELQYWLTPHPSIHRRCGIEVERSNGESSERQSLDFASSQALWELQDGDLIHLTGASEKSATLRFRLLEISDQALLAFKTPVGKSAALELPDHRYISTHDYGRSESQCAVMFYKDLLLCRNESDGGRPIRTLPGESLSLTLKGKSLDVDSEEVRVLSDSLDGEELPNNFLRYDSYLSLGKNVTDNSSFHTKQNLDVEVSIFRV